MKRVRFEYYDSQFELTRVEGGDTCQMRLLTASGFPTGGSSVEVARGDLMLMVASLNKVLDEWDYKE